MPPAPSRLPFYVYRLERLAGTKVVVAPAYNMPLSDIPDGILQDEDRRIPGTSSCEKDINFTSSFVVLPLLLLDQ